MNGERRRIMPEGVVSSDGRELEPHSVIWDSYRTMPLLITPEAAGDKPGMDGHDGSRIVGYVDHVRREEDGWITGVPHFQRMTDWQQGWALEADCEVQILDEEASDADRMVIASTMLRAVTIGVHPCWPECGEIVPDDNEEEANG